MQKAMPLTKHYESSLVFFFCNFTTILRQFWYDVAYDISNPMKKPQLQKASLQHWLRCAIYVYHDENFWLAGVDP